MKNKYNEYTKLYNQIAEEIEKLGGDDEIFQKLSKLCNIALNINIDDLCYEE